MWERVLTHLTTDRYNDYILSRGAVLPPPFGPRETGMGIIARYTQVFSCYLSNTRAVSALEYALAVGVVAVAIFGAYQAFGGNITAAMTALGQQVSGTN